VSVEPSIRYETSTGYAEQAARRAARISDPIDGALLAAVSNGSTVSEAARAMGIPRSTARDIVRRLMGNPQWHVDYNRTRSRRQQVIRAIEGQWK